MRKRFISFVVVLAMLMGVASATMMRDLRWNYFASSTAYISMKNGEIEWSGDASTYSVASVTSTKVTVKLQVATQVGWGTIETKTGSDKNDAGAVGTYSDWVKGESYRVSVEAYAYNGTKELEHIGPFYDYLNT